MDWRFGAQAQRQRKAGSHYGFGPLDLHGSELSQNDVIIAVSHFGIVGKNEIQGSGSRV